MTCAFSYLLLATLQPSAIVLAEETLAKAIRINGAKRENAFPTLTFATPPVVAYHSGSPPLEKLPLQMRKVCLFLLFGVRRKPPSPAALNLHFAPPNRKQAPHTPRSASYSPSHLNLIRSEIGFNC